VGVEDGEPRPYGRRAFLGLVAAGLSSFLWASPVSRALAPLTSGVSQMFADVLPVGGWRIYTISGSMPSFDPSTWRLDVSGLVEKTLSLSFDDLQALRQAHQISTFHCVTGWTVQNVHWTGVRFEQLFALCKPLPSAKAINFVSLEQPYTDSLTMQQATMPDVMLALGMDGAPLSRPHGAPARVVIPEMYGYKGVKWLTRMEFVAEQPRGFWESHGYDQHAWVGRSNGY
jgi:DMSO/TMAO reductase YedYZ molybdopterin-dependent catalytic subunit